MYDQDNTPAVTTFILLQQVKFLQASKEKNHYVFQESYCSVTARTWEPLLTSALILPDQKDPLDDPYDIENQLKY